MRQMRITGLFLAFGVAASLLGGCATTKQGRSVDVKAGVLLDDYSILREGKGKEVALTYKNEKANWANYTKVMIDPVLFQKPEKASEEELADLQKLASNLHSQLMAQLGADYQVVTSAGPNTIRVQTAFFDAEKKGMVGNFLSSLVPVGVAISILKDFATGKPLSVGEISGEAKVTDSETGELLAAALDRRVGQKYSKGTFSSWAEANDAMEYWAKRMRFAFCQTRGGANCVEP
jgi:hypothetical protein